MLLCTNPAHGNWAKLKITDPHSGEFLGVVCRACSEERDMPDLSRPVRYINSTVKKEAPEQKRGDKTELDYLFELEQARDHLQRYRSNIRLGITGIALGVITSTAVLLIMPLLLVVTGPLLLASCVLTNICYLANNKTYVQQNSYPYEYKAIRVDSPRQALRRAEHAYQKATMGEL